MEDIAGIEVDMRDSTFFVQTLKKKVDVLQRSIATRDYFDLLDLA